MVPPDDPKTYVATLKKQVRRLSGLVGQLVEATQAEVIRRRTRRSYCVNTAPGLRVTFEVPVVPDPGLDANSTRPDDNSREDNVTLTTTTTLTWAWKDDEIDAHTVTRSAAMLYTAATPATARLSPT